MAKSVQVNEKVRVTNGVDSSHLHCTGNLVQRDIRIEDVLDLREKFNDVLFMNRNTAKLVERSAVNTNDILVLGEKINDSLVVSDTVNTNDILILGEKINDSLVVSE